MLLRYENFWFMYLLMKKYVSLFYMFWIPGMSLFRNSVQGQTGLTRKLPRESTFGSRVMDCTTHKKMARRIWQEEMAIRNCND